MTARRKPQRMPPRLLLVHMDRDRGVALVRGPIAGDLLRYVNGARIKWSERAGGWVVSTEVAIDLIAFAEYRHAIVKVVGGDK